MFSEWALGLWSLAGIVWWMIALCLVRSAARPPRGTVTRQTSGEMLSIFKPLPPLGPGGLDELAPALESFLAQLDLRSEMLLGIHEVDRGAAESFLEHVKGRFPDVQLKTIFRSARDEVANPKIAWQKILAPHATGELWLWSDADVIAPPGFVEGARAEFAACGAGMLTFPYVVRKVAHAPALLDALFVNAEFYPGVLLLRRAGTVDFGLGAAMFFRRADFLRKVEWPDLGAALADDFVLGQRLGPVRLSETTLEITPGAGGWKEALLHHLRWSKTVWWNRPLGAAARIVVLPVAGWMVYVIFHPAEFWAWAGLVVMMGVDICCARVICQMASCPWAGRDWLTAGAWSAGRVMVWLACWFPWPVLWAGRRWYGPKIALQNNDCGEDIDKD